MSGEGKGAKTCVRGGHAFSSHTSILPLPSFLWSPLFRAHKISTFPVRYAGKGSTIHLQGDWEVDPHLEQAIDFNQGWRHHLKK